MEKLYFITSKLRRVLAELPYLPRALGLVWQASRGWTTAWVALLVVQGLLPVATVYLTRPLVDRLVQAVRSGGAWPEVRAALGPALLMGLVLLLGEALRSLTVWVRTAQSELVRDHITSLVHRKSIEADLAFYDSPDFYDHLHRARSEATHRPLALVENLGNVAQNGITLAAMLTVLLPFGAWLPVALLASTLPAFYVVLSHTFRQYEWRMRNTANERRTWYYDWLVTAGETAAELRLFGLGDHFRSAHEDLRRRLRNERIDLAKGYSLAELAAGGGALLIAGISVGWMAWRTARGRGTLGDLALFYQAFNQGLRLMRTLLESAGQLYANILFLGNLFEFLALEPQVVSPPAPRAAPAAIRAGIRFENVTFRYPGSERVALQDFSLAVPAGQIVAIVGPNGAGKSTLIKLLCRFYDPAAGRIELDGIDLRDLP
ncbi:MAG: ABC transporter ATP-binding protein, partial [Acidobacteria bacterium]|nr:ABC transporter ATP-binding protein [Acidobacteriota bacterium]